MTDPPVVPITRLDLRFAPRPWVFAEQRRAEIDRHFAARKRDKPALWNGRVLILHEWEIGEGLLRGAYLESDYASFLAWRDWDFPDVSVKNCFGMGALRSADGAFLLGLMAEHTANAGTIYFPAGTPEPRDISGTTVDLGHSVMRELTEETGLGGADIMPEAGWHAVLAGPRIAMIRVLQARESAVSLQTRIRAHLAREPVPELAGIRIVRGLSDLDPRMPIFVTAYLRHVWA